MTEEALIDAARAARGSAYAPYSGFAVGCAIEAVDGRRFVGCNVENASLSITLCAERVALGAALVAGCREFARIVVVTEGPEPATPCGACRQALAEFSPMMEVLCVAGARRRVWRLDALLPDRFILHNRDAEPDAGGA
jgi:homotetrameric cytidine deaminase